MWTAMLLAALLVPQQGGGRGGVMTSSAGRVISLGLTLAAPVQSPDGRLLGSSVRIPDAPTNEPWFVYSRGHFCDSVITRGTAPTDATEGWRISIVERSRTQQQLSVAVTWFRMWERGRLVTAGSGGTSELTLRSGDRIPLDQITRPSTPANCPATQKTLELQVTTRITGMPTMGVNGVVTAAPVPEPDAPIGGAVTAELWMVHRLPNGTETVQHQAVRLVDGGVGYTFRGSPVESADGPLAIEVTGQLRAVLRVDGTRGLWTGFTRSVTHQSTGSRSTYGGGGDKTVDWLAPDDLVSFDLPTPWISAGQATAGGRGGVGGGGGAGGAAGIAARGRTGDSGGVAGGTVAAGGVSTVPPAAAVAALAQRGPNLLEGHRLSVRIRLIEAK